MQKTVTLRLQFHGFFYTGAYSLEKQLQLKFLQKYGIIPLQ